ncbi:MAG: acetyltransferase, family [Labilithrix sp.]|nr:acetyltransferase, family [Labilithrix sp.]
MDTQPDETFTGDPAWKVVRTLRDGGAITIRPIMPDDREELRRAFADASLRTRYLRFLGGVGELSEETLTYLTCVDQHDHIALVATMTSPDLKSERGVGVARVIRLKHPPDTAEAAITVTDDMQKRGVGSALAHELEHAARASGIRHIRADVLEGNSAMRGMLEGAGARRVDDGDEPGTISYDIALEPSPSPSTIVEMLRVAAQTTATR